MRSMIRIGFLSQSELPKQLEPMIEAIFREQFRKLSSVFGSENLALVGSVESKFGELACVSAVEEGLILEIFPLETSLELDEEEVKIKAKIYTILGNQPGTIKLDKHVSETELIGFCDIMKLAFYGSNQDKNYRFETKRDLFFGNDPIYASL